MVFIWNYGFIHLCRWYSIWRESGGIVIAWVCVGYSGEELIFSNKPHRKICKNVFQIDDDDIIDRYWIDDKYLVAQILALHYSVIRVLILVTTLIGK